MQGELIAERYKPLFPRARGGFSDVIIAWDTRLARRVAIKKVNTGTYLPVTSLEEARTAALLSSPNIVGVYDFEGGTSQTLIIMENVDGPSLAELMSDSKELLEIDVVTTILEGIAAALEYAHENQVLHLDIKPANILIDQSAHIKVSDFGLAELVGSNGFGEVQGGTIGYMPPEQLAGELVDVRTDIWALAALSYQLLTGVNPFFALSFRESLECIIAQRYALPSELRPALGGGLDEALIKALSPERELRPATVAEFWLDIHPHLGRISPGRRKLKTLARAWAGKEAALLEGTAETTTDPALATGLVEADEDLAETVDFDQVDEPSQESIAIWNGNYDDDEDDDDSWTERTTRRQYRRAERQQRRDTREPREPGPPLWQRLSPRSQAFFSRCFCALATGGMTWLAMSALPYLSDPLAQAATVAAASTGNPVPALLDAAFTARLFCALIAAVVAFLVPGIGAALAVACLGLGFFFTGNWLLGILISAGCVAWWVFVGRRSAADATIFSLASLLALVSLPLLAPLLSGYFQNWRRALGTTALSCLVCSLLSILTYGSANALLDSFLGTGAQPVYGYLSELPLEDLLSISFTLLPLPDSNQLFIPLISLFTSPEFWFIFVGWLGASVVMSLLCNGKSRVKYILATLISTGIVAAGYLLPFFFFVGPGAMALLAGLIVRLLLALAACLLLIALGVTSQPSVSEDKGRKR